MICRRFPGGFCGTLWEFPGGKREMPESPEECLIRELEEELEVYTKVLTLFDEYEYQYPDRTIYFRFYDTEIIYGAPIIKVHSEIRWVSLEALDQYQFCPADESVVKKLREM